MKRALVIVLACLTVLCSCTRDAERGRGRRVGAIDFDTSCNKQAQRRFETGVALLHHTMLADAERSFTGVAGVDPECSIAHWGLAMTRVQPLSVAGPAAAALEAGTAAVEQARALGGGDKREQAFIEAVATYYSGQGTRDARLAAWERGQTELFETYPDDPNAAAFYALARLATAPAGDRDYTRQKEIVTLLEAMLLKHPRHPGVLNLLIRASDNPPMAARAANTGRAYEQSAPDVGNAQHLPSHIFTRLGSWDEVVRLNLVASSELQKRRAMDGSSSSLLPHSLDYLMYAYMQGGWLRRSQNVLHKLTKQDRYEVAFESAFALAAIPARRLLEQHAWEEAAELTPTPESFPWDVFPAARAVTHFARGLGAARGGSIAAARVEAEALDAIHEELSADPYWGVQVDAWRKALRVWILGKSARDEALALLREAADLEDSLLRDTVSPGPLLPLRELYGDMMLAAGRNDEALAAYLATLETSPGRLNALYGAATAAARGGDAETAALYYERVVKQANPSSPLPSVVDARERIGQQR